jgi:hypothetical protein
MFGDTSPFGTRDIKIARRDTSTNNEKITKDKYKYKE